MDDTTMQYDVAIVGCGPVGATLANYLSQFGHSVAILDRYKDVFYCPRAGGIDDESLRSFDTLGILDRLAENGDYYEADLIMCDANERPISVFNRNSLGDEHTDGHAGYPVFNMFYQPNLERVLREAYADSSLVTSYMGYDVLSTDDMGSSVRIKCKNLDDGSESDIEAQFVVGCDGARSMVQKALGVGETNFDYSESYLIIDAVIKDKAYLKARFPDGAKMIFDPIYAGIVGKSPHGHIRLDLRINDHSVLDQKLESKEDFERAAHRLINERNFDYDKFEIVRLVKYVFEARTPDKWRVGRLLVAGDAAHLTPPWAGQGLNMGIRDAANLSFKLHMVLTGRADESLLDTYADERRPASLKTIAGAVNTGKLMEASNPLVVTLRNVGLKLIGMSQTVGRTMAKQWQNKPPYQDGFIGKTHSVAGSWMIQPLVTDRNGEVKRLDKLIGLHFALISTDSSIGEHVYRFITELDAVVLKLGTDFSDHEGRFMKWCKQHRVTTVLIRPDRYVFDAGKNGDTLCASLFEEIKRHNDRA